MKVAEKLFRISNNPKNIFAMSQPSWTITVFCFARLRISWPHTFWLNRFNSEPTWCQYIFRNLAKRLLAVRFYAQNINLN
jgi:hypothetical protein